MFTWDIGEWRFNIFTQQSLQVDAGVVVGLKEQAAMLVQDISSIDKPDGEKENFAA